MDSPLSITSSSSSSCEEADGAIVDNLFELDEKMKNYSVEFFISIDSIRGIIHVRKANDPPKYSAMFSYIVFRKFDKIETIECSSLSMFMAELDKMLQFTFTTKFQSKLQNDCFIAWRNYIHSVQNIPPEEVMCYVCLEDSFDSHLACGHHLCQKCLQKSEKNPSLSISTVSCGICRKKITRKVTNCINLRCNHRLCRFSEEITLN